MKFPLEIPITNRMFSFADLNRILNQA
jgi:hypothetical protein